MADMIITVSGDHDDDVPTRLAALGDSVTFDVKTDCWLYSALNLSRFDADATTDGFVPVPAGLIFVALGRGAIVHGLTPLGWYATDSAPSDVFFNNLAINAAAKGFPPTQGDGEAIEFSTAWHCRAALGAFARNNADYTAHDNTFVVADEEDRFDANCADFTEGCLQLYNGLMLQTLVHKKHMDSWSMLLWLLGWSMEQPDEDLDGEFCIVARALEAAAKAAAPHLAEASPASAVASFLRAGEQLPPDMLTDDTDLSARLQWIGYTADYVKPSMRAALLQGNFDVVLAKHDSVAKWTGSGGDAYVHFISLVNLIFPGLSNVTFDVVPRLGAELANAYDDYWKEGARGDNIEYLREMLGSRSGGPSASASTSSGGDVGAAGTHARGKGASVGAAQLTALLAAIDKWRAGEGGDDGGEPHVYGLIDIITQSGYTPAVKWVLGLAQPNLPSVFSEADIVGAPLEWDNYFLDTIVTGSDGEPDELLAGLTIDAFASSFITSLKAGKLKAIDWDADFVCVVLRELNASKAAKIMTVQQDGKFKRWTASAIDRTLDGVMQATLAPDEREHKTFHSKRVWLASALKKNGHPEGEIQALVQWRSVDSIRIYGRMDEMYQAECRERASTATFTVMNASSLPQVDPIRYTAQGAIIMPELHNIAPLITAA